MRIFDLPEHEDESANENSLKTKVVESVLKVACPNREWSPDCLLDTYRIGKPGDYNRTVITTFKSVDQKFNVFEGRENLRKKGIKIANELTSREKQALYDLKQKGKKGYFYKGKLHIRSDNQENSRNQTRVYINAKRKIPNTNEQMETGDIVSNATSQEIPEMVL